MGSSFLDLFSNDLAIDLGTSNTLIYVKGKGVVCNEPSVVAVQDAEDRRRRRIVAVGIEAKNMLGRTPDSISAVRPLRDGVITDFDVAEEMLRQFIKKANARRPSFLKPRIIVCVPHGITEVEKRAVRESAESAGAREVHLIEEPMAAALGAKLPITEACGSMVLNVGGGTSEVAVISLKGIVFSQSVRVAGDKMDDAIVNYVRRRYNLLIGDRTAEQIKIAVGSALPTTENLAIEIRGRDLIHGVPRAVTVQEAEVREAIQESLHQIVELVRTALEKTPPELSGDIVERGITLTGGGALLRRFDDYLSKKTGLRVILADDPISTVVMGSGLVLDQLDALRDIMMH